MKLIVARWCLRLMFKVCEAYAVSFSVWHCTREQSLCTFDEKKNMSSAQILQIHEQSTQNGDNNGSGNSSSHITVIKCNGSLFSVLSARFYCQSGKNNKLKLYSLTQSFEQKKRDARAHWQQQLLLVDYCQLYRVYVWPYITVIFSCYLDHFCKTHYYRVIFFPSFFFSFFIT